MPISRALDNQLRKLNKRVMDARKLAGINSTTYQLMQKEMLDIDRQLQRETGKSFLTKKNGAFQFVRSAELEKLFGGDQLEALFGRLEAIGTVGKELKAIKQAAKAIGEDVKKIDFHEWVNRRARRNQLLDYAFEYLYSLQNDDEDVSNFFDNIRNREFQEDTEQKALDLLRRKMEAGAKASGGRRGWKASERTKNMNKYRREALKARTAGDYQTAKESFSQFLEWERGREENGSFRKATISPRELDILFDEFLKGRA